MYSEYNSFKMVQTVWASKRNKIQGVEYLKLEFKNLSLSYLRTYTGFYVVQ